MLKIKGSRETAEIQGEMSIGRNGGQVGTVCRCQPRGAGVDSGGGGALGEVRLAPTSKPETDIKMRIVVVGIKAKTLLDEGTNHKWCESLPVSLSQHQQVRHWIED